MLVVQEVKDGSDFMLPPVVPKSEIRLWTRLLLQFGQLTSAIFEAPRNSSSNG